MTEITHVDQPTFETEVNSPCASIFGLLGQALTLSERCVLLKITYRVRH